MSIVGTYVWPVDKVEKLISLWNLGCSAAEVAKGLGISRMAVVGKVYRLRMSGENMIKYNIRSGRRTPAIRKI